jgi:hypothetical protein
MLEFRLAEAQHRDSLTVFPLVCDGPCELKYDLLADALAAGTVRVTEVGSGSVPEISVENRGDADVLVLDGEQLVGAKQNRTVSRSLILAAGTKTTVPVSCMEHGRWHLTSREFTATDGRSPARVRRHARKAEAACARAGRAPAPRVLAQSQADVWAEIDAYSAKLGSRSETGALDHLYRLKSPDLEEWSTSFPWVDDQVGLLAFLGDQPLGLDVIGGHRLYARLHRRILSGYIMDALAAGSDCRVELGDGAAAAFLERLRAATRTEAPSVGRGTYRVLSSGVMGGELVNDDGELVHLCAFPAEDDRAEDAPGFASPSRRRRHFDVIE